MHAALRSLAKLEQDRSGRYRLVERAKYGVLPLPLEITLSGTCSVRHPEHPLADLELLRVRETG